MSLSPSLPRPRSVAWSAWFSGSLASVLVRRSVSVPGAWVCVCSFRSFGSACRLARLWSVRLGRSVVVRRSCGFWCVSVPVGFRSSRLPVGVCSVLSLSRPFAGARGLASLLGSSGLAVA